MLELRGITAGYASHTVLRDVSISVPANSVVALLGPNGAGKTTVLRVASGLVKPSSGRMLLEATDATGWPPERLARGGICHVPEGRGIFAALSVRDNLRLQAPAGTEQSALSRVVEVFPRLGERMSQRAGTLSGGEQQMLALAHAYVGEPTFVLLDEVSMGLAPIVIDAIFGYLRRLAAEGVALLLVEQYVSRALALADYVYVLNKGRVVFAGEPGELGDEHLMESYLGQVNA
jgi:branched-chain amino acid transport system ATP-binding protein